MDELRFGEHWRDNLAGLRLDDRIKKAIHAKNLEEIRELTHKRRVESCVVAALKKDRIAEIGFNKPNDLILDNYGKMLAGLMGATTMNLYDVSNTLRSIGPNNFNTGGGGTVIQLGGSTTPPARGDYKIGAVLGTAPENTYFSTGYGSYYPGGYFTFSNGVSAGGSGTVNEAGFFGYWYFYPVLIYIMLFHDLVTGVPYTPGNPLVASWVVSC